MGVSMPPGTPFSKDLECKSALFTSHCKLTPERFVRHSRAGRDYDVIKTTQALLRLRFQGYTNQLSRILAQSNCLFSPVNLLFFLDFPPRSLPEQKISLL
jgi:hypothetical protein